MGKSDQFAQEVRDTSDPSLCVENLRGTMKPSKLNDHSEKGASLVEYVILVALIAVTCIFAIQSLGQRIAMSIGHSTDEFAGAGGGRE